MLSNAELQCSAVPPCITIHRFPIHGGGCNASNCSTSPLLSKQMVCQPNKHGCILLMRAGKERSHPKHPIEKSVQLEFVYVAFVLCWGKWYCCVLLDTYTVQCGSHTPSKQFEWKVHENTVSHIDVRTMESSSHSQRLSWWGCVALAVCTKPLHYRPPNLKPKCNGFVQFSGVHTSIDCLSGSLAAASGSQSSW